MDKNKFLRIYRTPRIRIWFDDNAFAEDQGVTIAEEHVSTVDFKEYYVLRAKVDGQYDARDILERLEDKSSMLITAAEASVDPAKWDLGLNDRIPMTLDQIQAIPIATDLISGKTLVLDSNHSIVNLLSKISNNANIPVVRLLGTNMENFIIDFKILNRQS